MSFYHSNWINRNLKTCYSLFYSLLLFQCVSHGQVTCCCGTPKELDFPGFDFEIDPLPPSGSFFAYGSGSSMGPWNITSGFIDQVDKHHYYDTGYGNPNGASTFIDLYGSPSTGSVPGAMAYPLTGLTPGYQYTIEFYYAKFDVPGNFIGGLKVASGAWLNITWKATNPGNIIWLKASYNFIAKASSAILEFYDAGSTTPCSCVGALIDDIKIYECPTDLEKPVIGNPPVNIEVECDNEVPEVPLLDISDNCDANPITTFKETKDIIDACTKKITREWTITDACGNTTSQKQIIDIIDKSQPIFIKYPEPKTVSCDADVIKEFNNWVKKNGNAIASDACGPVSYRSVYTHLPKKYCDSVAVDFIAIDPCGNEITETVYFIVKDTVGSKFLIKPQDKSYADIPNIKDSLRAWLSTNAYSTVSGSCDTTIYSSNFNGDSTRNPLTVTFYIKDRCGNVDSSTATFSYKNNNITCCCGNPQELNFPGLDFEFDPLPPPAGYYPYVSGMTFGPWTVTNGAIDHGNPLYCGVLAGGNPNGASFFIDLFGSPPGGSVAGTLEYILTGLTPGNTYTIEFWYATYTANGSFSANLKVANGAWLNVSWNANNPGSVIWLKNTYSFVAKATSATMSFTDTGASSSTYQIGMLLDDIKIYECPSDLQKPVVNNPPKDIEVECDQNVPPVPTLNISDNCDPNPQITYNELFEIFDHCTKKITRNWDIKDACGNVTNQKQIIDIIDKTPPAFTTTPVDKTVFCGNDVAKEFDDWIKKNGNGVAKDQCGVVTWRINYDHKPAKFCDTVTVEFIAEDECGNQQSHFSNFVVRDTTVPRFIVKPQSRNYPNNFNIRDSLRAWLNNYGYSKTATDCDTIILSSDFNGDSTKNPLSITFFAKDRCGNIDSSSATFAYQSNACCCGVENELFFPNLDFEAPPIPVPGGWIDYGAGSNYAGWTINTGSISIHSPTHLNLGAGNPNGSSQHMDLHGSTQGSATYTLTGLTAGNKYTISFWYAIHSGGSNVSAILRVNGGSLLNVSWNASNHGDVIWLPAMYDFIADGPTADMTFVGTGSTGCCGMLIDDIHIFECPGDKEKPMVNNPPDDIQVECDSDVPPVPNLNVSDNCDANPKITFKEVKQTIDPCTKKITRSWEIKDACGNVTLEDQIIDIIDKNPPVFTKQPETKLIYCNQDVQKEFNDWIKKNGNAIATDNCGAVNWRKSYDRTPHNYCDTVLAEFFVTDPCGNENSGFAYFVVQDTSAPRFIVQAQNKNLKCSPNTRDSLRAWLSNYGFSKTTGDCDTVIFSSNFNGDSTKNPIPVTFFAKDRCGNVDSSKAVFSTGSASDTFGVITLSCTYPMTTIDTFAFKSANGCDSVVIVQKIRKPSDSTYLQLNTCDPKQKGFDTTKLRNIAFCDSILFIQYVFRPTPVTTLQVMDCAYTSMYQDTLTYSGQYCDSLIITQHIPLRKDSITIRQTTCDPSKEDTLTLNLMNSLGCDSVVTIQTKFTGQLSTFLTVKECLIQKDYVDTVTYKNGSCDSLVITQHIALPKDTNRLQSSNCDASKTGVFTRSLTNRYGCDSLIIETISLLPSDSVSVSSTTCLSSQAGVSIQHLKNKYSCDSIVTTTIVFTPSDTTHINTFTCDLTKARTDTSIISTTLCDSFVITNIVFMPSNVTVLNNFTCNINQQKSDTVIIATQFCDSLVVTNTKFIPSDTVSINSTTCIPAEAGTDTLNFKNTGGCDSLVYRVKKFVPKQLIILLDSISCMDKNDGKIRILNTNDFTSPLELILNNTNLAGGVADNLSPGNYLISVRDQSGCISDTTSLQLINPGPFTTELGSDLLVDPGQLIQLNLNANKVPEYVYWFPQGVSACVQCQQIEFTASQDEWIYTQAVDERGCESRDSIFIRIRAASKIFAPNAISNNGDNINDNFYLIGDDNIVIELMEIYDRWGELLFSTTNIAPNHPESGWDGTFNSQKMNPGVYIYHARLKLPNGESRVIKGDFTLIR